jgi:hypothetical protein
LKIVSFVESLPLRRESEKDSAKKMIGIRNEFRAKNERNNEKYRRLSVIAPSQTWERVQ